MKDKLLIILLIYLSIGFSCRNTSRKSGDFFFPENDAIPLEEAEKLSAEAIADISRNIASPVEMANLLLMLDVPFSSSYLASSIDPNKRATANEKALALGILGADLGYLNMYGMTGTSVNMLSSIKKLSEEISVGQFFDFETIKRLSLNKNDLDSLLFLSIDSYTQIDEYLRNNDRGHLSALMIIGVWLEGQYLATQVVNEYPDPILRDRIGEQKIILNDLMLLAAPYCNRDPQFGNVCDYLEEIKSAFRGVNITFTMGDPISEEVNGALVVTQTETSEVEMTDQQLEEIIAVTKKVRDKLISDD
ncbi:MAG TPA: hypothetical protein GXZ49_06665 [Bacteroidetes bacterium]|nr:hypothetical protein [Bacteroidota bacterium]